MSYYAEVLDCNFFIAARDFTRVLTLADELVREMARVCGISDASEIGVPDLLPWVGLDASVTEAGVDAVWMDGKYTSHIERLLSSIAPVIPDGSYIDFMGEDHALWRLYFEGGEMSEVGGRIVFD